jgi:hypothetical protein
MHAVSQNRAALAGRSVALLLVLAGALPAADARAQGQRGDDATQAAHANGEERAYDRAVELGVEEYSRGNWAEAFVAFRQAYRVRPGPRPLRGMGIALFEQKRYAEAVAVLEQALTMEDAERPLDAEQRAHVERSLAQARQYAAAVVINTQPKGAQVEVDGRSVRGETVLLDGGRYEIVIRHSGYQPERRELEVGLGERRTLTIVLQPQPGVAQGDHTDGGGSDTRTWVGWTIAAAGAAAIGSGLVLGAINASDYDALRARCDRGECDGGDREAVQDGRSRETLANALIVGGAALAVGGAVLALWPGDESGEGASARLAPSCTHAGCGLTAWGRF